MDRELCWSSAIELAARIRSGEVSSREATDAALDRIDRLDDDLGLVVTLDAERARAEAAAADEALAAGSDLGALHGVPITVKDSFQTAGMRTTSGAPELADHVPETDADPVARYRELGVVVMGKTNLPIYAGDVQSYNDVFGCSNNPWDRSRTVGGSSGGSAGALAAGFTPLELGSDIGGSIRNPAHTCGVVGHKPSYGIVSARGQIPGPPGTLTQADIAVAGPMARTVADCRLALDALSGPDAWQRRAWRLELPPPRHHDPADLRVAAWLDDPACPVGSEVRPLLEAAAVALADVGVRVDADARPDGVTLERSIDTFERLLGAALAGAHTPAEIEEMATRGDGVEGDLGAGHAALRHRAWLSVNERRLQLRARWAGFFEDWDAVLMPVAIAPAIPHDHSSPLSARRITVDGVERPYLEQTHWVGAVGVVYLPATVVPIGLTPAGLPVGVQVVGPYLEDHTCLRVAELLEVALGGFRPPPGLVDD